MEPGHEIESRWDDFSRHGREVTRHVPPVRHEETLLGLDGQFLEVCWNRDAARRQETEGRE